MGRVEWHGDKIRKAIERQLFQRLEVVGVLGVNHAKKLISVEGTGNRIRDYKRVTNQILLDKNGAPKTRRLKSGDEAVVYKVIRKKKGSLVYGFAPSQPGEPPRKQTGRLLGSVAHEVDREKRSVRIGTNVIYGRYLELGTSQMAPRPWLRRMLLDRSNIFRRILTSPMNLPNQ